MLRLLLLLLMTTVRGFSHLPFAERRRLAQDPGFRRRLVVCTTLKRHVRPLVMDLVSLELLDAGDDGSVGGALSQLDRDRARMARRALAYVAVHQGARLLHSLGPHPPHV